MKGSGKIFAVSCQPTALASSSFQAPPAADLKRHGRSVEAYAEIDLPKWFKARVIIGHERSVDEAREQEAAGCRESGAAIFISFVHPLLHLTGEWIDDDHVGFVAFDISRCAAR